MVSYVVDSEYTLPADQNSFYCGIIAEDFGPAFNCGENAISNHNFAGYADAQNDTLKCTNSYPILNGARAEDDPNLRYRIVSWYSRTQMDSMATLKLAGLNAPGMINIKVVPNYFGIGSVGIFCFSAENKANPTLLQSVELAISEIRAPGVTYYVLPGVEVSVDLEVKIYVRKNLSSIAKAEIKQSIRSVVHKIFATTKIQGQVDLSLIASAISTADQRIVGFASERYSPRVFENVNIRRGYGSSKIASERETVVSKIINLKAEEYASLGSLSVSFEVDSK